MKAPPDSLVVFPNPLPSALGSRLLSIGMEWIPMEWMPMELRRPEVGSRARLGSSGGESAGKPPPGPQSQPRWGRQNGRLRTGVRRAIIGIIADHHCRRPADRPPPARRCAPPTRAWRMRWTPSSPTTPSASIRPSSASSTTSVATWAYARCRQSPSPWPAIWPPAPVTAPASPPCAWATSAITKAHEWAGQESPCRDQGVRASLK